MPDPNNPLSYIGQSNDPSLTQRTVDTNRSLQEMRRNLGQIASEGGYASRLSTQEAGQARTLERLKAQNVLANTAAGQHMNINDPNYWEQQEKARIAKLANTLAQANLRAVKAGQYNLAPPGANMLEALDPKNLAFYADAMGIREAEARNEALTQQLHGKDRVTLNRILTGPKDDQIQAGAFTEEKRESETGRKATLKGGPDALKGGKQKVTKPQLIRDIVYSLLQSDNAKIDPNSIVEDEKYIYAYDFDGNEYVYEKGT